MASPAILCGSAKTPVCHLHRITINNISSATIKARIASRRRPAIGKTLKEAVQLSTHAPSTLMEMNSGAIGVRAIVQMLRIDVMNGAQWPDNRALNGATMNDGEA